MKCRLFALCLCAAVCLAGCRNTPRPPESTPVPPTAAAGELRGVWLSFLELDELLGDADDAAAKARLDRVLDTCKAQGMNTVFFHVRAHSDAYYPSEVYPAAQAAAPLLALGFDPLAYAVDAAHDRGLSLHAWINPYRIGEDKSTAVLDGENEIFTQAGVYYYNPGNDNARRLVLDGVRELLDGYAVDGIHFDDYFYPAGLDTAQGERFEAVPTDADVGDWRRSQVNGLISAVWSLCRQHGRVFGVSPIALPEKSRTSAYADVALWMRQRGYIDYICPQIYYGFDNSAQPYARVLEQWAALPRHGGVSLYVGLALYKAGLTDDTYAGSGRDEWAQNSNILARQVTAARDTGQVDGFILFRYDYMTQGGAAAEEMQALQGLLT